MRVLIIGAGGHGQVVADILLCMMESGQAIQPVGYLDDNVTIVGRQPLGIPILGTANQLNRFDHDAVLLAIGHNPTRQKLFERLSAQGEVFATALHPSAIIARDVRIGVGTVVCAGVIVNPGTHIGDNTILNTGCTIDHHNKIGDHTHIAPGVHLGGDVTIGAGSLIGIGASVMPQRTVGPGCIVGAGALVQRDLSANVTAIGVPAKIVKRPAT